MPYLLLVKVKKGRQETTLPLLVVEGNGPPLLGRDWLAHIPIDWKEIKTLSRGTADEKLASLKAQYPRLWKERLDRVKRKVTSERRRHTGFYEGTSGSL